MSVTPGFRRCAYIRRVYHDCLSHMSRMVSDAVCISGVSIMSVCHTCHAWFQTLCVYQVCLSCLSHVSRIVSNVVCISGVATMSVCHTCHAWFQTLCVYQVCLSCLSVTRVTPGFRRCVYIRCVYHVCLSHVSRLVSDAVFRPGLCVRGCLHGQHPPAGARQRQSSPAGDGPQQKPAGDKIKHHS